eukprot:30555-Pelagococcus_subviridis.AAC.4
MSPHIGHSQHNISSNRCTAYVLSSSDSAAVFAPRPTARTPPLQLARQRDPSHDAHELQTPRANVRKHPRQRSLDETRAVEPHPARKDVILRQRRPLRDLVGVDAVWREKRKAPRKLRDRPSALRARRPRRQPYRPRAHGVDRLRRLPRRRLRGVDARARPLDVPGAGFQFREDEGLRDVDRVKVREHAEDVLDGQDALRVVHERERARDGGVDVAPGFTNLRVDDSKPERFAAAARRRSGVLAVLVESVVRTSPPFVVVVVAAAEMIHLRGFRGDELRGREVARLERERERGAVVRAVAVHVNRRSERAKLFAQTSGELFIEQRVAVRADADAGDVPHQRFRSIALVAVDEQSEQAVVHGPVLAPGRPRAAAAADGRRRDAL